MNFPKTDGTSSRRTGLLQKIAPKIGIFIDKKTVLTIFYFFSTYHYDIFSQI
jgi:hypothetical protein